MRLQVPSIPSSTAIGQNEDGSDITQDVDVLVWCRHVGQSPISMITRQFLPIHAASGPGERVFSFAGLAPLRPAQISA